MAEKLINELGGDNMTIEIDGQSYEPIEELDKQVAQSISDGTESAADLGSLAEKYQRLNNEVENKRAEREQQQTDKDLKNYITDNFSSQLKDPNAFYNLCKARKAYEDTEVLQLFKMLPKQAKKGLLSRFLK